MQNEASASNIRQFPASPPSRSRSGDGGGKLPPLDGDGGGPHDPGMEARIKRLEDDFKEVRGDLKAIRTDLSELKGRISQMPTTLQLVGFVFAVLVAGGVMKHFFG